MKQRVFFIDLLRVVLCVLVVFSHTSGRISLHLSDIVGQVHPYGSFLATLVYILSRISNPGFFIISGMMLRMKAEKKNIGTRDYFLLSRKLYFLFFFLNVLYLSYLAVFEVCFWDKMHFQFDLAELIRFFFTGNGFGVHLWFLASTAWAFLLVGVLRHEKGKLFLLAVLLFVSGVLLQFFGKHLFVDWRNWTVLAGPTYSLLFVALGYYGSDIKLVQNISASYSILCGYLCIVLELFLKSSFYDNSVAGTIKYFGGNYYFGSALLGVGVLLAINKYKNMSVGIKIQQLTSCVALLTPKVYYLHIIFFTLVTQVYVRKQFVSSLYWDMIIAPTLTFLFTIFCVKIVGMVASRLSISQTKILKLYQK